MNKKVQLILVIVCGILFGVMIFSVYQIVSDKVEHKVSRDKDTGFNAGLQNDPNVQVTPRPYALEPDALDSPDSSISLDDEISPLNALNLDKFFSDYPDAIGWIYSPNGLISYGVVEAEDNDFYLHRFYDGTYSVGGSLFADCQCPRDFSARNTIIYGHHMNDGTKFASLVNYREQAYYNLYPVMYLNTRNMNYRVEIFSAYLTDAESDCYTLQFDSDEAYVEYLRKIVARSDFKTNVSLSYTDRIITLSTCSYEYNDARYVVHGKLVPIH